MTFEMESKCRKKLTEPIDGFENQKNNVTILENFNQFNAYSL